MGRMLAALLSARALRGPARAGGLQGGPLPRSAHAPAGRAARCPRPGRPRRAAGPPRPSLRRAGEDRRPGHTRHPRGSRLRHHHHPADGRESRAARDVRRPGGPTGHAVRDPVPDRPDARGGRAGQPVIIRGLLGGAALGVLLVHSVADAAAKGVIRVGSKSFTESYILAEAAAQVIEQVGEARVERRGGLGGTGVTYRAIESGAIDLYPQDTGTLALIIFKEPSLPTSGQIPARLQTTGRTISQT